MQPLEKKNVFRYAERILYVCFFLAALILCGQISYSDGDDAYFYSMAHSMPLFPYLKMRYIGWEGRMTSEAMTYIAFYFGKTFWQFANAAMLTLLPTGLVHILKKMAGGMTERRSFCLSLSVCLTVFSLGIEVIGYGAFWITGSTFYLWSIVPGIWAAMPFVELAYGRAEPVTRRHNTCAEQVSRKDTICTEQITGSSKRIMPVRMFLYAIPCGFIAAMGQEQIAAVVIAFGILALFYYFYRERRVAWLPLLEVAIMIAALAVLFISPGTSARSQAEIEQWMPQYATMSLGNHIFITLQWLLSSFANEGKMLFCLIWGLSAWLLVKRRNGRRCAVLSAEAEPEAGTEERVEAGTEPEERKKAGRVEEVLIGASVIFAAVALLPYFGIHVFSEMGMGVTDITQCVSLVATPASLSGQNWLAMIWWILAVIFTIVLLWRLEEQLRDKMTMSLMVLAACASEAIMFFSPTMYASGARVYFMAQILLWLLIGRLCGKLSEQVRGWKVLGLLGIAGAVNFISGVPVLVSYLR